MPEQAVLLWGPRQGRPRPPGVASGPGDTAPLLDLLLPLQGPPNQNLGAVTGSSGCPANESGGGGGEPLSQELGEEVAGKAAGTPAWEG